MSIRTLQQKIDQAGSALAMLRNSQAGPYVFPIPGEFSNWRLEQHAWREGVALIDQSFHMTDLYVEGPDTTAFISSLAINSFAKFGGGKAKQFVACGPDGYLIGDMIVFGLSDTLVDVVGRPTVANWIEYQASLGCFDVTCVRDERTVDNAKPRRTFRFQVQGPDAWALLEDLNGDPIDQPRFFQMGELSIAGHRLRSLRHGMGGAPGLEFWGPVELYEEVLGTILEAGHKFDLRRVGARAYGTAAVDSGWLPCPLPSIYAGEATRAYREWLPAASYEGMASLGGSFVSDTIQDYFFTPWDLDYGRIIRFDHDFIGRDALRSLEGRPHRRKVSLVIDPDDAAMVFRSQMSPGGNGKAMEMPSAHYAAYPYDAVLARGGDRIGVSTYLSFIAPDNALVALAVVDEAFAAEGSQVDLLWGEPEGGPYRPVVEPHVQMVLKATVACWPFSSVAQTGYRPRVLESAQA